LLILYFLLFLISLKDIELSGWPRRWPSNSLSSGCAIVLICGFFVLLTCRAQKYKIKHDTANSGMRTLDPYLSYFIFFFIFSILISFNARTNGALLEDACVVVVVVVVVM